MKNKTKWIGLPKYIIAANYNKDYNSARYFIKKPRGMKFRMRGKVMHKKAAF